MTALVVQVGTESRIFHGDFEAGRKAELLVPDDYATGRHARFTCRDGCWYVEDLGSANGTWLNRRGPLDMAARVYGRALLTKGDKVQIGRTVLTVVPVEVQRSVPLPEGVQREV